MKIYHDNNSDDYGKLVMILFGDDDDNDNDDVDVDVEEDEYGNNGDDNEYDDW